MDKIKMGDFLQSLRNEKDLTQTDVAEIFTVTPQAVSKWESGQSIPDVEMLEKLSKFYKVSINEILAGERRASSSGARLEESDDGEGEKKARSRRISRLSPFIASCIFLGLSLIFYFVPCLYEDRSYWTVYRILGEGLNGAINWLIWIAFLMSLALLALGFGFFFDEKSFSNYALAQQIIGWAIIADYLLILAIALSSGIEFVDGYFLVIAAPSAYIVLFYILPQNKRKRLKSSL